jgi:hypothetical protein
MKKTSTLVGAIALTFAVGGALILGNAAFAAQTQAAVSTAMLGSAEPASTGNPPAATAAAQDKTAGETTRTHPISGAEKSVVMKTLPNGSTVLVEYFYDADGAKATVTYNADGAVYEYEGEAAEAAIERFGGPKRDIPARYVEGRPGEGDITEELATFEAMKAIANKYALTAETFDRFGVNAKFYSVYEDVAGAVWFVQLYPATSKEFSEIGAYSVILNAATGEALQVLSADDGKG